MDWILQRLEVIYLRVLGIKVYELEVIKKGYYGVFMLWIKGIRVINNGSLRLLG